MYPFSDLTTKFRRLRMMLPRRDFITAAVLWVVISVSLIYSTSLTAPFDNRLKDYKLKFNASYLRPELGYDMLLLAIDSETLAEAPYKWPWPQSYWAQLLRRINEEGKPRAVIIDVFFQTPETENEIELLMFAQAITDCTNIGLVALYEELVTSIGRQLKFVPPHEYLRSSASFYGLSQQPIDEDGKIRSFILRDHRIDCRHIAWGMLQYLGQPIKHLQQINKRDKTVALIDFAASDAGIAQIGIKQLLDDERNFEYLKDRIVVIGATAPVLHDYHQTPLGLITGPEIICNTFATLASGRFQLLYDSMGKRLIYYLLGVFIAIFIFTDLIKNNLRQMVILWLLLPIFLFFYSFLPLEHPPVVLTWASYSLTAFVIFLFLRFLEISELREQLLEGEFCGAIQKNFFPSEKLVDDSGVICYGICIPYKDAGGDYYDFFPLKDGRIFFILGDVTGHGLSASMITTVAKTVVLLESEHDDFNLQRLLQEISLTIFNMTRKRRMMSAVAGIIDPIKRKLQLASAGHLPSVMKTGTESMEIPLPSLPLGLSKKPRPFTTTELDIPDIAKLFVYSDGIIEGVNWKNQMFGYDCFNKLVADLPAQQSLEEDASSLIESLRAHSQGRTFEDDVTLLIIDLSKEEKK
ncbi:MAG: CHASE2 domain-containing protein [Candidatus Riflebacteria bacterium]|nr:CHASE2 domain-containing protein [Candidatus Riflebacteria bacterium]